jgi:hypothetical protein
VRYLPEGLGSLNGWLARELPGQRGASPRQSIFQEAYAGEERLTEVILDALPYRYAVRANVSPRDRNVADVTAQARIYDDSIWVDGLYRTDQPAIFGVVYGHRVAHGQSQGSVGWH